MATKSFKLWLREASDDELDDVLRSLRCSSRKAKWIYRNVLADRELSQLHIEALGTMSWRGPEWVNPFIWQEFEKYKSEPFAYQMLWLMRNPGVRRLTDVDRIIALYSDPLIHEDARAHTPRAVYSVCFCLEKEMTQELTSRVRAFCSVALKDSNPHARMSAIWLANFLGGFESELEELSRDETPDPHELYKTVGELVRLLRR